jgi:hypothetical protein
MKRSAIASRVILSLFYLSVGLQVLAGNRYDGAFGQLVGLFDEPIVGYVAAALLALGGLALLLPLLPTGISPAVSGYAVMLLLVLWGATIVVADLAPGFGGFSLERWLSWTERVVGHLLVLGATFSLRR